MGISKYNGVSRWNFAPPHTLCVYRQSVYIGLGDYQTLLRPLRRVQEEQTDGAEHGPDRASDSDEDDEGETDEARRDTAYGDDTLRAIAVITQKYDSFKRRQAMIRSALQLLLDRPIPRR